MVSLIITNRQKEPTAVLRIEMNLNPTAFPKYPVFSKPS